MTYLPMTKGKGEDETGAVSSDESALETATASGYTISVPVANLTRRDDDPRYLSSDVGQAVAHFLEAGPPPLTAYESVSPGKFVVVIGAPYLPALEQAFNEVPVTVYPYAPQQVLAHLVTPNATVGFSRLDRARRIWDLVSIYANESNPYAEAADATAGDDGEPGVKAAQMRNYESLAKFAYANGDKAAEKFSTTVAPQMRQIAEERGVEVEDLTTRDLATARREQHAKAYSNHLIRIALQPYGDLDDVFMEAWDKAPDGAGDRLSLWATVAECLAFGVDAYELQERLFELLDEARDASATPHVGGQGSSQLLADEAANTPMPSTAGTSSPEDDAAVAHDVEDADFIDTPPHDAASATGGESSTGSRATEPTHGASDTTCVMTGRVPVPVRSVTAASDLGTALSQVSRPRRLPVGPFRRRKKARATLCVWWRPRPSRAVAKRAPRRLRLMVRT